jgi:hypothetical protein
MLMEGLGPEALFAKGTLSVTMISSLCSAREGFRVKRQ